MVGEVSDLYSTAFTLQVRKQRLSASKSLLLSGRTTFLQKSQLVYLNKSPPDNWGVIKNEKHADGVGWPICHLTHYSAYSQTYEKLAVLTQLKFFYTFEKMDKV